MYYSTLIRILYYSTLIFLVCTYTHTGRPSRQHRLVPGLFLFNPVNFSPPLWFVVLFWPTFVDSIYSIPSPRSFLFRSGERRAVLLFKAEAGNYDYRGAYRRPHGPQRHLRSSRSLDMRTKCFRLTELFARNSLPGLSAAKEKVFCITYDL